VKAFSIRNVLFSYMKLRWRLLVGRKWNRSCSLSLFLFLSLSLSISATDITDNTTSFVNCETSAGFYGRHGDGGSICTICSRGLCPINYNCSRISIRLYVYKDRHTLLRSRSASRHRSGSRGNCSYLLFSCC